MDIQTDWKKRTGRSGKSRSRCQHLSSYMKKTEKWPYSMFFAKSCLYSSVTNLLKTNPVDRFFWLQRLNYAHVMYKTSRLQIRLTLHIRKINDCLTTGLTGPRCLWRRPFASAERFSLDARLISATAADGDDDVDSCDGACHREYTSMFACNKSPTQINFQGRSQGWPGWPKPPAIPSKKK